MTAILRKPTSLNSAHFYNLEKNQGITSILGGYADL